MASQQTSSSTPLPSGNGPVTTVSSGQVVNGGTISPDATQVVSGGTASGMLLQGSSAFSAGSTGAGMTTQFARQDIIAGGAAVSTIVKDIAIQTVLNGGVASGTVLTGYLPPYALQNTSSFQVIESGGIAIDTVFSGKTGEAQRYTGLTQSFSYIKTFQTVESGGTVSGNRIGFGGASTIEAGGSSVDTTLSGFSSSWNGWNFQTGQGVNVTSHVYATLDVSGYADKTSVYNEAIMTVGGTADHTTVFSGGSLTALNGATLSHLTVSSGGTVSLGASTVLTDPLTIERGGGIVFSDISSTNGLSAVFVSTPSVQNVTSGATVQASSEAATPAVFLDVMSSGTVVKEIAVTSAFSSPIYFRNAPSGGGTEMLYGTPCYCPGTLIQTPQGERPVEDLVIGDLILTASGDARPIRWIGRRAYDPLFAYGNRDVLPILFHKGSLGNNLPKRDLTVSPLHAMLIDGYLIPALHLVNDHSILQIQKPETIRYIHIELDSHDILLAEGAPSESFLDDRSRGMFHNAHEYEALYPDAPRQHPRYCAPRLEDGPELAQIHSRLKEHAKCLFLNKAA
ncbi:Hint domain-containing protein [Gluconobacter cerinus]|uniref:Hint domain-containing protein n=1 Tax=Gluconobacter cerinus TaxID=38307 RepID=UPI003AB443B7